MTKLYPIQVIALDKIAHQALELAELKRFDETVKAEPKQLASVAIGEYHQIFVLSELNDMVMQEIEEELSLAEEPIVLLPRTAKESENMKQLLLMGVRVVFSSSDSLVAVSLSHTLKMLELMFYENGTEMEIAVDYEDIYEVMGGGTITEFYENSGTHIAPTSMNLLNVPESFSDVSGVYILYDVHEDLPIMEIGEAMNIVESKMPEESRIIFGTRNTHTNLKYIKITCMVSRYVDFMPSVQEKINDAETYIDKLAVIVDAYAENSISGDEGNMLADRNNLDKKDLNSIYTVVYSEPREIVNLMQMVRDDSFTRERKEEAIADVLIDTNIDADILAEIAMTKELSIDNILVISKLKKEGKLPLQDVGIPDKMIDTYPNLVFAKSADTFVLVDKNILHEEEGHIITVATDELKLYEKNGVEWFVGKELKDEEVDSFTGEYGKL